MGYSDMDESPQIGYSNQMNPRNSYFIKDDTKFKKEEKRNTTITKRNYTLRIGNEMWTHASGSRASVVCSCVRGVYLPSSLFTLKEQMHLAGIMCKTTK